MFERMRARYARMKQKYEADELFHDNEVQANRMIMKVLVVSAVILLIILASVLAGVFPVTGAIIPSIFRSLAEILALWFVCRRVKSDAWWLKHLLLLGVLAVYAQIDVLLTHKVAILMVLPILCSTRYFSMILTRVMSLLTAVVFLVSAVLGAFYGWINMNDVIVPVGSTFTNTGIFLGSGIEETLNRAEYARHTILFSYFPKLLMFGLAAIICVYIARRGRQMVEKQKVMSANSARMETELNMAMQIQKGMLPSIFPPFPDRKEFDIYGTMDPAREVGGDFFDFFFVDDDHLALIIADVSGKGVPAALFMMASKIILANHAMMGKSPAQVLEATNDTVCANNPKEMFVTVWLGILEISTGILTASSAGHEYPALEKNGRFELLKDKHGLVIGGYEGIQYKEYTLQLCPGDKLFLYTDGVPEAADGEHTLFGTGRMLEALNLHPEGTPETILEDVQCAVNAFVGKAEQFDDLTMLCLAYHGRQEAGE